VPTQHHGLFCPSPHPTSEQPGGAPGTERGHSRDSWPQLAKGISHTVRRRAQQIKLVEEGKGGTFRVMASVFPSNRHVGWSPALLEIAEHLPAGGKQ